jgi:polyhydroxyalkanoate synthase
VINKAKETSGDSLKEGFLNMLTDLEKGRITQTDDTAFTVGENLAITPGAVIYQNDLIQLIQYSPVGKEVYEIPLLIVPPWINKYYILDLQPKNSFVHYLVEKGFTVFMISWKNPNKKMKNYSFDDYVDKGILNSIDTIKNITGEKKVNTLGYCLGGTLLGVSLAIMHARKDVPIQSATFLASMLDFTDVGPMGDVIDQAMVSKLERGELQEEGVMHGHDMEKAFNLIRANDLIWNYVVNNYLKGNKPTAFDLLFWTNDNTNLPANMYAYYMRHMILENKLSRKNALRICDTPISIGKIETPSFIIAMKEDHISPPQTAFTTTELLSGPVEFILSDSGHVMGVANPPSKKKYGYSKSDHLGYGFEEWRKNAKHINGSWWTPWSNWLKTKSGKKINAPTKPGNKNYKIIEKAPGTYVKEKCKICPEEFF